MKWKIIIGVVIAVIAIVAVLELFVISVAVLLIGGIVLIVAAATYIATKFKKRRDGHASEPDATSRGHSSSGPR